MIYVRAKCKNVLIRLVILTLKIIIKLCFLLKMLCIKLVIYLFILSRSTSVRYEDYVVKKYMHAKKNKNQYLKIVERKQTHKQL
jgi:hypothetical protein